MPLLSLVRKKGCPQVFHCVNLCFVLGYWLHKLFDVYLSCYLLPTTCTSITSLPRIKCALFYLLICHAHNYIVFVMYRKYKYLFVYTLYCLYWIMLYCCNHVLVLIYPKQPDCDFYAKVIFILCMTNKCWILNVLTITYCMYTVYFTGI